MSNAYKMLNSPPSLPPHAPPRPLAGRTPDSLLPPAGAYTVPPTPRGPGAPSRVPMAVGPSSVNQRIPGEMARQTGQSTGAPSNRGSNPMGQGSVPQGFPPSYGGALPARPRPEGPPSPMQAQAGYSAAQVGQNPPDLSPRAGESQQGRSARVLDAVREMAARNRRG